jgi:hypothetical protein
MMLPPGCDTFAVIPRSPDKCYRDHVLLRISVSPWPVREQVPNVDWHSC